LRNIFKESHRLLSPGGLMAHGEGVFPTDLFAKYYAEWMAHYNNEPFLGSVQDEDFDAICDAAGFTDHSCGVIDPPSNGPREGQTRSFFIASGCKAPA